MTFYTWFKVMDNESKIENFEYLWDTSSPWALVNINSDEPDKEPEYVIFNIETSQALLIHNNDLYRNVEKMMIEKGVKIIPTSALNLE